MESANILVKILVEASLMIDDRSRYVGDPSLKIEFREFTDEDFCSKLNFTLRGSVVEKWPECGGEFMKTSKFYCGKPVYVNTHPRTVASLWDSGGWSIGDKIGRSGVRSDSGGLCPTKPESWKYWDWQVQDFFPADITVMGVLD